MLRIYYKKGRGWKMNVRVRARLCVMQKNYFHLLLTIKKAVLGGKAILSYCFLPSHLFTTSKRSLRGTWSLIDVTFTMCTGVVKVHSVRYQGSFLFYFRLPLPSVHYPHSPPRRRSGAHTRRQMCSRLEGPPRGAAGQEICVRLSQHQALTSP